MPATAKGKYQMIVGHICSKCGKPVLTNVDLITQGCGVTKQWSLAATAKREGK